MRSERQTVRQSIPEAAAIGEPAIIGTGNAVIPAQDAETGGLIGITLFQQFPCHIKGHGSRYLPAQCIGRHDHGFTGSVDERCCRDGKRPGIQLIALCVVTVEIQIECRGDGGSP